LRHDVIENGVHVFDLTVLDNDDTLLNAINNQLEGVSLFAQDVLLINVFLVQLLGQVVVHDETYDCARVDATELTHFPEASDVDSEFKENEDCEHGDIDNINDGIFSPFGLNSHGGKMRSLQGHEDQPCRACVSNHDVVLWSACMMTGLQVAADEGNLHRQRNEVNRLNINFVGVYDEADVDDGQHSDHPKGHLRSLVHIGIAGELQSEFLENEATCQENQPGSENLQSLINWLVLIFKISIILKNIGPGKLVSALVWRSLDIVSEVLLLLVGGS